jgi:hypothetical protein
MPFDQVNFPLPAVETDEVLRALVEGRAMIADPRNWLQGPWHVTDVDGTERYCSAAALNRARNRIPGSRAARAYLMAAVPPKYQGRMAAHIFFNDDPTTTHADVLAMWDRAISARRADLSR